MTAAAALDIAAANVCDACGTRVHAPWFTLHADHERAACSRTCLDALTLVHTQTVCPRVGCTNPAHAGHVYCGPGCKRQDRYTATVATSVMMSASGDANLRRTQASLALVPGDDQW